MSQLAVIDGFKVIALKDGVNLDEMLRRELLSTPIEKLSKDIVDIRTSLILNIEIPKIMLYNRPFVNNASDYYPKTTSYGKYVSVYPQYVIRDNMVPYLIQKSGLNILRESQEVFIGRSNKADYAFELFDADGNPIAGTCGTRGMAGYGKIIMNDLVAVVSDDDYKHAQQADKMLKKSDLLASEIDVDYLSLALLIKSFYSVADETENIFLHEIKHCKNSLLLWPRLHMDEVTEFSGLDCWRENVDDEISAKLAEVIDAVSRYLKKGQADDLGAFENAKWIQAWLYSMDESLRIDAAMNIPELVRRTYDWWMEKMYSSYSEKFPILLKDRLNTMVPARKIRVESDGVEYEKWRHLIFNYSVYNPATGHYVNMDLSQYVPKYVPTNEEQQTINAITSEVINNNNRLHLAYGREVGPELLTTAIALRQTAIEQNPCICHMKEMSKRENLSVAALFDLRDGIVIVDESQERLGQQVQVRPHLDPDKITGYEAFTINDMPVQEKKNTGYEAFTLDDTVSKKKGRFLSAVSGMIDSAKKWFVKKSDFQHD